MNGSIMRWLPFVALVACSSTSRGGAEPGRDGAAQASTAGVPAPATPATATPPAPPTTPRATGKGVEIGPTDVVFIGKPRPAAPLDCATFDSSDAPHRRPPMPLHDATDYPQRHWVPVEIVEVVRNPSGVALDRGRRRNGVEQPPTAMVAWALGPEAFEQTRGDPAGAYDVAFCRRLNQTLAAPFVVVHAIPIYVDYGNSAVDAWREAWESIGVRLDSNTAGFATLEEARGYLWLMHSDRSTKPTGAE